MVANSWVASIGFGGVSSPTYTGMGPADKTYTENRMTFDARSMKLLAPGGYITSPEYPGLRFEAFTSQRTWTYRYRSPIDGKLRQVKIGAWPAMSVHAAVVAWEKLRDLRAAGSDPALEEKEKRAKIAAADDARSKQQEAASYTVRCVCDDYWSGHVHRNRAKKGATEVFRMFDTMLGDVASIPAGDLTRAQAFDLINFYAAKAPVQAGKLRAELGAAWDYAIDSGRLPETAPNWWRLIMRGRIRSKGKKISGERVGTAKRFLTPEEVGTLIRWLPNFTQLIDDTLTLYLWTCTRGAEIVGMRGSEIAIEADGVTWWTIPKARTKNARHENATDLRVPLFGRALAVVSRRREVHGDGFLFPARTIGEVRPIEQKTIQSSVFYYQPYSQTSPEMKRPRLTVSHWAPHDLRRTSRTLLASLGCPDSVGEAILGHMLAGVMGVYNRHAFDKERVEWLKRLSDHLEHLARV